MRLLIDERRQSSLTLFYWKILKRTLAEVQQPVIDLADKTDPEDLKRRVPHLLDSKKLKKVIDEIWIKVGSKFAVDTQKNLDKIPKKADPQIDWWEDYFRTYTNERSQKITGQIMDTQTQIINNIIDRNMEEARQGGLGIPETGRYLRNDMMDTLTQMNKYQAERIARTEVIGSSNTGSFEAASKSGLEMKKIWLTSGLDGIRESHIRYGAEDEQSGGRAMDEPYANGLQYPSDPNADPEEIINCRCTVVYDVDEGLVQEPEPAPVPEPEPEPEPVVTPEPTPEPVLVQPETVIPDIEKIQTYEELYEHALKYGKIDISYTKGQLNLDAQKIAVKRLIELRKAYGGNAAVNYRLALERRPRCYASGGYGGQNLSPSYWNSQEKIRKAFASDQITYFHPRGIPQSLVEQSIIDHEFAHSMTYNELRWKQGMYGEIKNLKSEYTRKINGLAGQKSVIFDGIKKDWLEANGGIEAIRANPEMSAKWDKLYKAGIRWNDTYDGTKFQAELQEFGIYNQKLNQVLNEFEQNYISGYGGKNVWEFVAEGFSDAINNKVNPSPYSFRIKEIVDKKYKL